jgi:hypothetical protein
MQNLGKMCRLGFVLTVASFIVLPGSAFAYIDPGAGSLFLQILFGGIGGLVFVLRAFRGRISNKFKAVFGKARD